MKQIRCGVFETNSSGVHSITICMESDYEKWMKGELYWDSWDDNFISKEQYDKFVEDARKNFKEYKPDYVQGDEQWEEKFSKYLNDKGRYYSYDRYCEDPYLEEYEGYHKEFATPSGEKVIAFGYYGSCL